MKIFKSVSEHVKAFLEGVLDLFSFNKKYKNPPFERIIFVCGINANLYSLRKWKQILEKAFPQTEILIMQKYYSYKNREKVEEFLDEIFEKVSQEKKTLLIGYSFGGLLTKVVISRLKSAEHVLCLVTLATPHTMENFGIKNATEIFKIPASVNVPTITFGGNLDIVVPSKYTKMKDSTNHYVLACNHLAFGSSRKTIKNVLEIIIDNCIKNKTRK